MMMRRFVDISIGLRLSGRNATRCRFSGQCNVQHRQLSSIVANTPEESKFEHAIPISSKDDNPASGIERPPSTTELDIVDPGHLEKWPMFTVLSEDGRNIIANESMLPNKDTIVNMYKTMGRIQALDDIFFQAQRQGRISFYLQNAGEEGLQVGAAAALEPQDMVFAQYREVGVLLWRGFTLQEAADQCFSNADDLGKGRQMPIHYGSKKLNFQTISSPLGTQIPQAVGAAYAQKLAHQQEPLSSRAVSIAFFGEGAASEGDFHAGLNMAATLEAPVLFFCRNNGYAISTPSREQFRGDGVVSRAAGYGMHAVRVDGNDALAVYAAVKEARRVASEGSRPVLIEAMTYRRGHHSTSDDSTRYRSTVEIKAWQDHYDPVRRLRNYIDGQGWWSASLEGTLRDAERLAVLRAIEAAERKPSPPMSGMFEDIYKDKPSHLVRQEKELHEHIQKHPEFYKKDDNH